MIAIARNTAGIDFDKQQGPTGITAPDLVALEQKIDELLVRLERKRNAENARPAAPTLAAEPAKPEAETA